MADLQIYKNKNDPPPNVKVRKLWLDVEIAQLECQVKKLEIETEEVIRAKLQKLEADKLMLKRKIAQLYIDRDGLDKFDDGEVIDIKQLEQKKE